MSAFRTQFALNFTDEILVDYFAGGGGASTGLEQGLQRPVAIAKNHSPTALSMHEANHPHARHIPTDVFDGDPREETGGRPVGWFHLSPDCTDHSQAKGGQPRRKEIRALAWVALRWAGIIRPRVISLENVKQILQWGPLVAKRCRVTGRVVKIDGSVATIGERVPVREQYLVPDHKRAGQTWARFVAELRRLGYVVEWRVLCAADFGAPTTRSRLFMVARRDGRPIVWPAPTHAEKPAKRSGMKRWRAAAECIDWTIPCPSIFERKRPLAEATMRRLAKGLKRYVLDSTQPFIVPIANWSQDTVHAATEPLRTVTGWPRGGSFAIAAPVLAGVGGRAGQSEPRSGDAPLYTITGKADTALITAYLAQHNNHRGGIPNVGRALQQPLSTITTTGSQQGLVTAHLAHLRGNCDARSADEPLRTVSAGGEHHGLVTAFLHRQFGGSIGQGAAVPAPTVTAGGGGKTALVECTISPEHEAGALRVAAFLLRYYSEGGQWGDLRDPLDTITTRDRMALVTVVIAGMPYVVVDIGLRMLKPRELFRAQGFPDNYIIEYGHDGRRFTQAEQVHMCGNSVNPQLLEAISRANDPWAEALEAAA